MPQTCLNSTQWDSVLLPSRRAGLAEAVQINVLADRMRLARHFDFLFMIVLADRQRGPAFPTVETRMQSNLLQLAQEVVVRLAILVQEDPTVTRVILAARLQQRDQTRGKRNGTALMRLRREPHVFLSADVVLALREVDVIPCGEGHFLVAASGAEKKLVADPHRTTD